MSKADDQVQAPLLEQPLVTSLSGSRLPTFSRTCCTVVAMTLQAALCCCVWAFVGIMISKQTISLPANLANLVYNNQNEKNVLSTMISTVLGLVGSFLLGIAVQHALVFRLARGVHLSMAMAWIQLARNSLFIRPHRHILWTILSVLWVAVIHLMTTAWSSILTPITIVQQSTATGREIDFLSPTFADFARQGMNYSIPLIPPTAKKFNLTPDAFELYTGFTGYLSQAGRSAALLTLDPGYPTFISQFNSSSGGVNLIPAQSQLDSSPVLPESYQTVPTPFILRQQGFTAHVTCIASSSPTLVLNKSASAEYTFPTTPQAFNYTFETWSWSTSCSGHGQYFTRDVTLLTSSNNQLGNGLFATSVCYYQDFAGPSNQSFLVLVQTPDNSGYSNDTEFSANPNFSAVCEVTPLVTTVEVQYNQSGLVNVNKVLEQTLLPDDSWPLISIEASMIWTVYTSAQGPYSNSFADDLINMVQMVDPPNFNYDYLPILVSNFGGFSLEQYLRGMIEYFGSTLRVSSKTLLEDGLQGQPIPDNMTVPINGTVSVQIVGWKFHPQTHGISVALITLVTVVTIAAGVLALLEANTRKGGHESLKKANTAEFDPTDLMDVLVASSNGNLAGALVQPKDEEEREKMVVELVIVTNGSLPKPVLNAEWGIADDACEREAS